LIWWWITVVENSTFCISPNVDTNQKTISVSAYAKCGVLNDCNPSSNQLDSLEFNGTKLSQIANILIKPFGLKAIFKDDEGSTFERVAIEPDGNILSFLIELANKRELIISSDKNGDLVFQKSISSGDVVANLQQNQSPVIAINTNFNSQNYYSHISGIEPIEVGLDGSKFTVKNELLKDKFRPFTYRVKDTETSDIKKAVNMKFGKMLGEMVSYDIVLIGWRDKYNKLFEPNTFINLYSPDNMIYTDYKFLIKSVVLQLGNDNKTTKINLVLPESYSGNIPKVLPWEE
jgi:prophage tail gpP-like protein